MVYMAGKLAYDAHGSGIKSISDIDPEISEGGYFSYFFKRMDLGKGVFRRCTLDSFLKARDRTGYFFRSNPDSISKRGPGWIDGHIDTGHNLRKVYIKKVENDKHDPVYCLLISPVSYSPGHIENIYESLGSKGSQEMHFNQGSDAENPITDSNRSIHEYLESVSGKEYDDIKASYRLTGDEDQDFLMLVGSERRIKDIASVVDGYLNIDS